MRDPSEDELDAWMSQLSAGERKAFDPIFRALYPRALRLARYRGAEDQAADAAQSVMMRVFARASSFEAGKPMLPWFYAIAANELRTLVRRRATEEKRAVGATAPDDLSAADDPERLLLERELRDCLERAISCLDETSAEAIRAMLDAESPCLTGREAAFRKRVSRAYAKLKVLLGGLDAK